MKFLTLNHKLKEVNTTKYSIKWSNKSPSKFQKSVKDFLKPYWFSHIVLEEFLIPGSLMRIDFLNLTRKICVEADGIQHSQFNPFFHNNSKLKYGKSLISDLNKEEWLDINGFKIVRINPEDMPLNVEFFEKAGVNL